jgi:beta-glucosidase
MPHKASNQQGANDDMNGLLRKLTLNEKILLLSAKNIWETPEIERVGIPSLKVGKPSL